MSEWDFAAAYGVDVDFVHAPLFDTDGTLSDRLATVLPCLALGVFDGVTIEIADPADPDRAATAWMTGEAAQQLLDALRHPTGGEPFVGVVNNVTDHPDGTPGAVVVVYEPDEHDAVQLFITFGPTEIGVLLAGEAHQAMVEGVRSKVDLLTSMGLLPTT